MKKPKWMHRVRSEEHTNIFDNKDGTTKIPKRKQPMLKPVYCSFPTKPSTSDCFDMKTNYSYSESFVR